MRFPESTRGARAAGLAASAVVLLCAAGCRKAPESAGPTAKPHEAPPPSNRIAIPDAVRRNLGLTFAKVERRAVAATLRYAGRFEAAPDARREHHAPVAGRVTLAVRPFDVVAAGTTLYRLDAPRLRELARDVAAAEAAAREARAKLEGLPAFRAAHEAHEKALRRSVDLWRSRTEELEALRASGAGRVDELSAARAASAAAESDLAETLEKDAELDAREKELAATRVGAERRAELLADELAALRRGFGAASRPAATEDPADIVVHADSDGVVEQVEVNDGAWVEAGGAILRVLDPSKVRLRAAMPQADLARVRDGAVAAITAPSGGAATSAFSREGALPARVRLALVAEADARTIDLVAALQGPTPTWARPGVVAALEVSPEGVERELAIPKAAVLRDGLVAIVFRRDPKDPDRAIRTDADLGAYDGRFVVLRSGVKEGDEIVLDGAYQLLLATSGSAQKGGHFHADGTFHADGHDEK